MANITEVLESLFSSLDNGSKGYLEEDDLAPLVKGNQPVKHLMQQLDADQDGMVSFTDFFKSYGAGMMANTQSIDGTDHNVASVPTPSTQGSNQQVISDETFEPDELESSLEATQTQRVVFRHKRYGRKSVSAQDDTRSSSPMLKPIDEQNTEIQILSPVTVSPSESRPGSSQEQYPDLVSQMESFYHEEPTENKRQSKVLSWISEGKDITLFEDTGNEQKFATFPRTTSSKDMPTVAEANAWRKLSTEITKEDISLMCQQSGGEEETEELIELFDKLDVQKKGYMKLGTFINSLQSQQNYAANVTSTPPPPKPKGWGVNMQLDQSFGTPLPAKGARGYVTASTPRQSMTSLPSVETPLAHVHLTSFGSENSNYVTADEVANVWNKLGIESTNEEMEHFIEKLPADQSGFIAIADVSESFESALVSEGTNYAFKKIAVLSIKHELSNLRAQVLHLSMERDKMKTDASQALETSRRIVREEDDIAVETQRIREAEKREIEKKYENKLKEQNRSWLKEIQTMSEESNKKVLEVELRLQKHKEEVETVKNDLEDARAAKEEFARALEKAHVELVEEQRARKALQRDLSCHPDSSDYSAIESLKERIKELEDALQNEETEQLREEKRELEDKYDVLLSEHENLKQRYFHERRKNQRLKKAQPTTGEASGRRSSHSRRTSHTKPLPMNNEATRSSRTKLETPPPRNNEVLSTPLSESKEDDDDMRSPSATLLDELTDEEHQRALNRIEELENKLFDLESILSKSESTTTELISSNKLLQEKLIDAEGRERITSQRFGQDLSKERQHSRSMGMQVDVLSKENNELTNNSVKLQAEIDVLGKTNSQLKHQCHELSDQLELKENMIKSNQAESEKMIENLKEKYGTEMSHLQDTHNKEDELNVSITQLKNKIESLQQELEDSNNTLSNVMDLMRTEGEEQDAQLLAEKEIHEKVIEQLQTDNEKVLESITSDLEDAQQAQLRYLEEAKEKEEIIEQMQAEAEKLKSEFTEKEAAYTTELAALQQKLQEENQTTTKQIQQLHDGLTTSQEKTVLLKDKVEQLESDIQNLKQQLEKANSDNRLFMEENLRKQKEIEKLSVKLSVTVSAVETDQRAICSLTDDLNQREKEIEVLQQEKKLIVAEHNATIKKGKDNSKAVAALKEQHQVINNSLKAEIKELQDTHEKTKKNFQEKIDSLESSIKKRDQQHFEDKQKLEKDKLRLEEEIRNLIATKSELEQVLHSNKLEIDSLNEKATQLEGELQSAATVHAESVQSLHAQIGSYREKESSNSQAHQEEISQLNTSLSEQKVLHSKEIQDLTKQLEDAKLSHSREAAQAQVELNQVQEELSQAQEEINQAQSALAAATEQYTKEKQALSNQMVTLEESSAKAASEFATRADQMQKRIDEHVMKLSAKDKQIADMTEEMEKQAQERLQLEEGNRKTLQEKEAAYIVIQEQLATVEQKLEETKNSYADEKQGLEQQVTSLEERLNESDQTVQELKLQVENLMNAEREATEKADDTASTLSEALKENNKLFKANTTYQTEVKTLQEEKEMLEVKLQESNTAHTTEITRLQNQLKMSTDVAEEAEVNHVSVKTALEQQVGTLEDTLSTTQKEVEQLQQQIDKLQEEATGSREKLSLVVSEKHQLDDQIEQYNSELKAMKEKCDALEVDLKESQTKCTQFEEQLEETRMEMAHLETANQQLQDKEATQSKDFDKIKEDLTSKLDKTSTEKSTLQRKVNTLENDISVAAEEIKELKQQAQKNKADMTASVQKAAQVEIVLTQKNQELQRQVDTLNNQLQELQDTKHRLDSEYKAKEVKITELASARRNSELSLEMTTKQVKQCILQFHTHFKSQLTETEILCTQKLAVFKDKLEVLARDISNLQSKYGTVTAQYKQDKLILEQTISKQQEDLQNSHQKNNTLDVQIKQLHDQISALENDYHTTLQSLQQECTTNTEKIQQLETENRNLAEQHKQQATEYDQLLENKETSLKQQEQEYLGKIEALQADVSKAEGALLTKQGKVEELQQLLQNKSAQVAVLEDKIEQMSADEPDAPEEIILKAKLTNFLQNLKLKLEKLENQKSSRHPAAAETDQLQENDEDFMDNADSQIQAILKRLDETQQNYSETKQHLENECTELKAEFEELTTKYEQLEQELQQSQQHHTVEIEGLQQQHAVLCETSNEEKEQLKTERDDLVVKCQELEQQLQQSQQHHAVEIESLQQQYAVKQKIYVTSNEEKEQLGNECAELKAERDELLQKCQKLEQQLQQSQQHHAVEIESMQQQYAVNETIHITSNEEKERLENECAELKTERDELLQKCLELEQQLKKSQQHYAVEIETLQQQFAIKEKIYETTNKETQSTIQNLKQQEEKLYTEIEVLTTELDTCKAAFAEREKIKDDNIIQLEASLQKSEEIRIQTELQLKEKAVSMEELRSQLVEKTEALVQQEQSNQEIQQFKEELVKLQNLLEEEHKTASMAQTQLDESFTSFSQEKTALESSIAVLNEKLTNSNEEITQLQQKSLETQTMAKKLKDDYKQVKEEYANLEGLYKTEKDDWTQRLADTQQTNDQLTDKVSSLTEQVRDLKTHCEELSEQLTQSKTEQTQVIAVEQHSSPQSELDEPNALLSSKVKRLEEELEDAKAISQSQKSQYTQLMATADQLQAQLASERLECESLRVQLSAASSDAVKNQEATKTKRLKELASLQSSVIDQMEKLQQLRDLLTNTQDGVGETTDPYSDLREQLDSLKVLCSERQSVVSEMSIQHDKDLDMLQQEHEEEVKALRQTKYLLQQKLQEADLKWNHYMTQQATQIKETVNHTTTSDVLLQNLYVENQQLEQDKAEMSTAILELKQEKNIYMKIITDLAYSACHSPSIVR